MKNVNKDRYERNRFRKGSSSKYAREYRWTKNEIKVIIRNMVIEIESKRKFQ